MTIGEKRLSRRPGWRNVFGRTVRWAFAKARDPSGMPGEAGAEGGYFLRTTLSALGGNAPSVGSKGPSRARSLLIAGAQKSSSTSLAELIGRHPHVSMAPREVALFEDPHYPQGLDRLLERMQGLNARGIVPALKRPELLYNEESAARAHRHLPEPLVVVVLREPVARTVSAYHHYVRHGLLPAVHPDLGIAAILDERRYAEWPSIGSQVVRYSLYSDPLGRLRREFGDQLLVLYQEELLSGAAEWAARILELLDIEPTDLGALPRINAGDYSLRHVTLSRLGGRIGYEVDEAHGTFRITPRPVRRVVGQALFALDRLAPVSDPRARELSAEVRARLVEVLAQDVQFLPGIVGRPLPNTWVSSLGL